MLQLLLHFESADFRLEKADRSNLSISGCPDYKSQRNERYRKKAICIAFVFGFTHLHFELFKLRMLSGCSFLPVHGTILRAEEERRLVRRPKGYCSKEISFNTKANREKEQWKAEPKL